MKGAEPEIHFLGNDTEDLRDFWRCYDIITDVIRLFEPSRAIRPYNGPDAFRRLILEKIYTVMYHKTGDEVLSTGAIGICDDVCSVNYLGVISQEQGKGYGTELLHVAHRVAEKHHVKTLELLCDRSQKHYQWYIQKGFTDTTQRNVNIRTLVKKI